MGLRLPGVPKHATGANWCGQPGLDASLEIAFERANDPRARRSLIKVHFNQSGANSNDERARGARELQSVDVSAFVSLGSQFPGQASYSQGLSTRDRWAKASRNQNQTTLRRNQSSFSARTSYSNHVGLLYSPKGRSPHGAHGFGEVSAP